MTAFGDNSAPTVDSHRSFHQRLLQDRDFRHVGGENGRTVERRWRHRRVAIGDPPVVVSSRDHHGQDMREALGTADARRCRTRENEHAWQALRRHAGFTDERGR
jgi:hypothetical protein